MVLCVTGIAARVSVQSVIDREGGGVYKRDSGCPFLREGDMVMAMVLY